MPYILLLSAAIASAGHLSDRQMLEHALAQEKAAHLAGNATLLVSSISPDFVEVLKGVAKSITPDALRARFQDYFSHVRVRHWDDITTPQIAFSADGMMATVLEQNTWPSIQRTAANAKQPASRGLRSGAKLPTGGRAR